MRLANAGGEELIRFVEKLNRDDPDSARLFTAYQRASLRANQAQARRDDLQRRYDAGPSDKLLQELIVRRSDYEALRLRAEAVQQSYLASQQGQSSTSLLQRLTRAQDATSDRWSRLQILVFIAVLAGLAVGVALAVLRAARAMRRAFG